MPAPVQSWWEVLVVLVVLPLPFGLLLKVLVGTRQSGCSWLYHGSTLFSIPEGTEAVISIRSLFVRFLPY